MKQDTRSTETDSCCKIGRLIREYELADLDTQLEQRWTATTGESSSLRELQREINRQLVRVTLTNAGMPPIDGEAENYRRILRSEDVNESRRIDARRRLENESIDVDKLTADFISHQTVYNHLQDCRDVSRPDDDSHEGQLSRIRSRIFGLQKRTELVTEQGLSQLAGSDLATPGEYDVIVDIQAVCEDCGRSHDIETLLSETGCQCRR